MYILTKTKQFIPALNNIPDRILFDSKGHIYICNGLYNTKVTIEPLLRSKYRTEDLTDLQYKLFLNLAKYHVNQQEYKTSESIL